MIEDLQKNPEFHKMMLELRKKLRPQPTVFHPTNSTAVEEWKYDSGRIAGFDALYEVLTGGGKK